ncbi:MAG: AsmA family protein [Alphaproteobacteria bacterium]|nr:AsmA family protein [Alphaproteobacteria bacterium]
MRRVIFAAAGILAVALAVILVGPSLVDWNGFRGELSSQLKASTGRDFVIEGDLRLRLIPTPSLAAQGVRIANPAGGKAPDLLRMRSIAAEVAFGPLLRGRLQVRSLRLEEPELVIERSGSLLQTIGQGLAAPAAAEDRLPVAVQFDEVTVRNGAVAFMDAATGHVDRFSGIDATISARSIAGPYRARGRMVAQDVPIDFELSLGEIGSGRSVPLGLTLTLRGGMGRVEVNASLFGAPAVNRLSGSIKAATPDLGASVAMLTKVADTGFLTGEAQLEATISATDRGLAFSDARLRWADLSATGALEVPLDTGGRGQFALSFGRIDLDAMLARSAAIAERRRRPSAPAAQAAFAVPEFLPGAFELKADALVYRGGVIRQARFTGAVEKDRVNLSQGRLLLPGGTDLTVTGALAARSGMPIFDGQVEANSDNLRGLLEWAGVDLRAVPLSRLRRLDAQSALSLRLPWAEAAAAVTLANLDLRLDVSRVRGGVAIELRRRLALGIGLTIDRLDLDAYLTPDATLGFPTPDALKELNTLDANLQLVVGAMTYRGASASGVKFDGTLQGGTLEVREAGIDQIAGGDLHLFGRLTGVAATPAIEVQLLGHAPDPAALFKLAGIDLPAGLRDTSISLRAKGGWQRLVIDGDLDTDGGRLQVKGTATGLDRQLNYESHVAGRHPSYARLAALLGFPGQGELGVVGLDLTVSGGARRSLIQAAFDIGPGSIDIKGGFDGLGGAAPAGSFTVAVSHPDLAALAGAFTPGRGTTGLDGAVRLTGRLLTAPEGITLNGIEGELGPIKLAGDAEWTSDGARPRLVAGLKLGETELEHLLLLAAVFQNAPRAETGDGGHWTSAPIDLLGLPRFDARVTLAAPVVRFGPYSIDEPRAIVTLGDRALALEELNGHAYSGTLKLAARLDQAKAPRLAVEFALDGADAPALADAARAGAGEGLLGGLLTLVYPVDAALASGRWSAKITAQAEGGTATALASGLSGDARIVFTDVTLDQFDLCGLAQGISSAQAADSAQALLTQASQGGTKLKDAALDFTLANGVARLGDQSLGADCGDITVGGVIDLGRWTQDLRAVARLSDVTGFPGVTLRQSGKLDAPTTAVANLDELNKYFATLRPATATPGPTPAPTPPAAQATPPRLTPPAPTVPQPAAAPKAPTPPTAAPAVAPRNPTPPTQTPPAAVSPRPPLRPTSPPLPAAPAQITPTPPPATPPVDSFRNMLDNLLRP